MVTRPCGTPSNLATTTTGARSTVMTRAASVTTRVRNGLLEGRRDEGSARKVIVAHSVGNALAIDGSGLAVHDLSNQRERKSEARLEGGRIELARRRDEQLVLFAASHRRGNAEIAKHGNLEPIEVN